VHLGNDSVTRRGSRNAPTPISLLLERHGVSLNLAIQCSKYSIYIAFSQ
jgi:hypothetical protein